MTQHSGTGLRVLYIAGAGRSGSTILDRVLGTVHSTASYNELYRVFEDKVLEINVPLHTRGRAQGVVQGGVLNVTRRTLPLRTTPANTCAYSRTVRPGPKTATRSPSLAKSSR